MKKLFNLKLLVIISVVVALSVKKINAQCTVFYPAQISEIATGTSSTPSMVNAGNDSKTPLNNNGSIKADVWEGNNTGGLGWDDNNGHASFLLYTGIFNDPD